jgi:hypothetical protein
MCGHIFLYQDWYRPQHRPVWQCSTCGRVSHVPLDCCTRPEVTQSHPPAWLRRLGQWVIGCGRWMLAPVRLLWPGQRRLAYRTRQIYGSGRPEEVRTEDGSVLTAARDERPEAEEMAVTAGERP